MELQTFAQKHGVRLNDRKHERKYKLSTNTHTIHGRYGEIVEDSTFGDVLAVKFIAVPRNAVMTGALRNRYRQALAASLTLKQKYDSESTFHFNPGDDLHAKLALELIGARKRRTRILTDQQRQAIGNRLKNARNARLLTQTPV